MRAPIFFCAICLGCAKPPTRVSEAPIPIGLAPGNGGLVAYGAVRNASGEIPPFPLLIDTATVLTSHVAADRSQPPSMAREHFRLLGRQADGSVGAQRAEFFDVPILVAPLAPLGIAPSLMDFSTGGGILGGDLLQQFSLRIDYAAGAPTIALLPGSLACSCAVADDCQVQLPFTLAGGGTLSIGGETRVYPPTRVTLDVCLQPFSDPPARSVPCPHEVTDGQLDEYNLDGRPGIDARLLVATGFPGVLLGARAYDRLCSALSALPASCGGICPAAALLDHPTDSIHFASSPDPVPATRVLLGNDAPECHLAAMALIERLGLLGPCGELYRSRRLRAAPADPFGPNCSVSPADCPPTGTCLRCFSRNGTVCADARNIDRCNDRNQSAAAYLEIAGPLPVYVVSDAAPILQAVNFDVRPLLSDVEGLIGTELLARLSARIDYPKGRVLANCAAPMSGCRTFPRLSCDVESRDCGVEAERLCIPPAAAARQPVCSP